MNTRSTNPEPDDTNRDFWEARGRSAVSGNSVTMLAEHRAYVDYVHRAELRWIRRQLAGVIAPRVLDLGCGAGRLAVALAPVAREIVGIELAESLVARAREAVQVAGFKNVSIEVGSLEGELPDASYDVAILSGVLNCVDNGTVMHALRQAARSLTPNGLLLIRNNCSNRTAFFRPASATEPPMTYRSGADYRRAVAQTAGLDVIEERYLFAPLCLPNLMYYYALPKRLRKNPVAGKLLDLWFSHEERTSERRLRVFARLYPVLLRLLRKPTAFRVLAARRR